MDWSRLDLIDVNLEGWLGPLRRLARSRSGMVGAFIVLVVVVTAILAPWIAPYKPTRLFYGNELLPPSRDHWFGTDLMGRDIFSFVVWGTRSAMVVAVIAVGLATAIGVAVGAVSGYFGGWVDMALMRFTDVILVTPILFLIILATALFVIRAVWLTAVIIGLFTWPYVARIVRSEVLALREQLYVEAARSAGVRDGRIILRHVLPNALPSIIVTATIYVAYAILTEASLGFLGLGDPGAVTWGVMLNVGRDVLRRAPWVATIPGLLIFITTWAFNLLGDGIREALDVKEYLQ